MANSFFDALIFKINFQTAILHVEKFKCHEIGEFLYLIA